jgi:hypothetical protein
MAAANSVYRTDDELRDVLDEAATWVVQGHGDRVFGVGGSLRRAIDRAAGFARSGAVVVSVSRAPPNRIFISHNQIIRIIELIRAEDHASSSADELVSL